MNVLFRCDGNSELGAGHLVRCSALAREISRRGGQAAIACRKVPESLSWSTAGLTTIAIPPDDLPYPMGGDGTLGRNDLDLLLEWADRWRADWIFIDHYGAQGPYLEGVAGAGYRLAVLDDIGGRDLRAAGLVVNPSPGAEEIDYKLTPGAILRIGPAFAPLRPEFAIARDHLGDAGMARRLRGRLGWLFVGFGGSDLSDRAVDVAAAVRSWNEAPKVSVAAGLDAAAVASAMSRAGLAISASGSTVWELCCLGVPAVVCPLAENQRRIAAALERTGAAVSAPGISEALGAARALFDSPKQRLALGRAAWKLVDGRGAERVVDEMEKQATDHWWTKVPLAGTDSTIGAGKTMR